jgi:long-chain acyl-CoA synthetase
MNVAELALKILEVGEHVSVVFEGQEITNVEMDRAANRLGNALKNLGVRRGDRVIIQMPNCPEVFQSFQAIWKIGAITVPINYQVGAEEIAFIYRDSGANTVISTPEYLDKVRAAQGHAPEVKNIIIVSPNPVEGATAFKELLAKSSDNLEMAQTEDDEVAALIYTSGTTAMPKGVMLTHAGLTFTAYSQQETSNLPHDWISLAVLPLCHSFGIATMNAAFLRLKGKTIILSSFNLEQLFAAIEKYKVNGLSAVPTMYVYMLQYLDAEKYDISSMKCWVCGSAPLAAHTWKQFKEKFGGEIAEGWGLTEAGANNTNSVPLPVKKVGSIGKPQNGMEMKIFDQNDNELPPGQEGEIVIRGPMIMKGYWKNPEATAEVIKDGWLHTGDIGYIDQDGYFFITDRKKDLIIKGGENISPGSIEEVLYSHPSVAEAAIIGVKDQVYGENIKAFVTLKPGNTATPGELMEFCQGKLKRFYVPKEIVIIQAMPKSLVGKILKKELRKS